MARERENLRTRVADGEVGDPVDASRDKARRKVKMVGRAERAVVIGDKAGKW